MTRLLETDRHSCCCLPRRPLFCNRRCWQRRPLTDGETTNYGRGTYEGKNPTHDARQAGSHDYRAANVLRKAVSRDMRCELEPQPDSTGVQHQEPRHEHDRKQPSAVARSRGLGSGIRWLIPSVPSAACNGCPYECENQMRELDEAGPALSPAQAGRSPALIRNRPMGHSMMFLASATRLPPR
jgi:hypothetical protein